MIMGVINMAKRYYWLKLQDNFFERDEIRIIESMPNGKDYILFYLKLLLKSINDEGKLLFKDTIPYTAEMLSTITNTNVDVVRVAVDTFIKLDLMEKFDDGVLFMREVNKMLGSETEYAQKKREYREKKISGQLEDKSKTKKDNVLQEKEIDVEKDTPYSPPKVGDDGVWFSCIKSKGYQFNDKQLEAISKWAKHQTSVTGNVSLQQVELTLKHLNELVLSNHDLVYMIETSISRGYRGIMEPTKKLVRTDSVLKLKYESDEYITPETTEDKLKLRNYLERCYMFDMIDPRTKLPLTEKQKKKLKEHYLHRKKQHLSFSDYVYQHEVLSGLCLLEQ